MESLSSTFKKSSFQSLKLAKQQFSKQIKIRSKKMKKYKYLKEEIYNNHNIFQSLTNVNHFNKTMQAQNIIWKKNYELKEGINVLKEQNSSLKARIWNVQKQNRKMDRQIQAWGLKKTFITGGNSTVNKPYIDTATAEKVLHDQDYSITSIKILIMQLQHSLESLSEQLQQSLVLNKNIKNIKNDMNHSLCSKKIQLYQHQLYDQKEQTYDIQKITQIRNKNREILQKRLKQLQIVTKNIELKKKSHSLLVQEDNKLNQEMQNLSEVTRQKISSLKQQAYKLKTEDESYVNEEIKKLANVKQKYTQFECKTQDKMGDFIKRKLVLNKELRKYQRKLIKFQLESSKVQSKNQEDSVNKQNKQLKQTIKPIKQTKPNKQNKQTKQVKQIKDNKQSKQSKQSKQVEKSKQNKQNKVNYFESIKKVRSC